MEPVWALNQELFGGKGTSYGKETAPIDNTQSTITPIIYKPSKSKETPSE